jgi:hypothetical protein
VTALSVSTKVTARPAVGFMRVGMRRLTELAEAEARPPA